MLLPLTFFGWLSYRPAIAQVETAKVLPDIVQFPNATPSGDATAGRALFLKNCAHCHGVNARGDEGPDLHRLDFSHEWIANRIRNGKAGEMTAFAGKLQAAEITSLITYLRTLK